MPRTKHAIAHLLAFVLLAACTAAPRYGHFISLPVIGWERKQPAVFQTDTLPPGTYEIQLAMQHSTASGYPYKELVVQVTQELATRADTTGKGFIHCADTVIKAVLFDDGGTPRGGGLSLRSVETAAGILTLKDSAAARITVTHLMRPDTITGIAALGVVVRARE